MRDDSQLYDVYDDVGTDAPRSRLGAAVMATVSLAVLAMVVVWAYRLGVRDAAEVPVIRAVEGPARVRPEDPGGAQFEHQGRAVYDALADAPAAPQDMALAPPPERVADEDLSEAERAAPVLEPLAAPSTLIDEATPAAPQAPSPSDEVDQLVAAALGLAATAPVLEGPAPAAVLPAPRPVAAALPASAAATAVPAAPVETAALDDTMIQLGAYLSAADAARMWDTISARNGDLLGGRTPMIAPLQGSTSMLYRLRAGPFASTEEARGLCVALQARGEDCLVAGTR